MKPRSAGHLHVKPHNLGMPPKLLLLLVAVVLIWLAAPIALWYAIPELSARGQFGDLFGSVNALFSGLAFAGIVWSLWVQQQLLVQREELQAQREELRLQREEMAASRAELARQADVQFALFKATSAQVTVASVQAEIEAIKLEAEDYNPGGRGNHIKQIKLRAEALTKLANWLEDPKGKNSAA